MIRKEVEFGSLPHNARFLAEDGQVFTKKQRTSKGMGLMGVGLDDDGQAQLFSYGDTVTVTQEGVAVANIETNHYFMNVATGLVLLKTAEGIMYADGLHRPLLDCVYLKNCVDLGTIQEVREKMSRDLLALRCEV